jgi:chemotaxis protein methyltransferase CheR
MPERQPRLPPPLLARLGDFLAAHTGLDFKGRRAPELERAMRSAAREAGHADLESYVHGLLAATPTRSQVEALASHLTVGETYFFREKEALGALESQMLAPLIQQRARGERRLRIWSAACSTGEEPYSIAMTLAAAIPDLREWNISILATDINPAALGKAAEGVYGEWSFRGTPADQRSAFFARTRDGRWQVAERVRAMVRFEYLNLAEDSYPAVANATNAMDAIFCRNVLMYFEPARAGRVLQKLARCLMPEGWLFLNPIEVSRFTVPELAAVPVAGTFALRRAEACARPALPPVLVPAAPPHGLRPATRPATRPVPPQSPHEGAAALYAHGDYAAAAQLLVPHASEPSAMALLARAYANQGRLEEALAWCERAVAADKLNAARYYLLSSILQEKGMIVPCERALQQALYLDPRHALAHFALGNLRRREGRHEPARRHFANALAALRARDSGEALPEAEGMSAGRLAEIVSATLASELGQ